MKKRFCSALLSSVLAVSSFVPASTTLMMAEEVTTEPQSTDLIYSKDELTTVTNGSGAIVIDAADVSKFADLESMTFEATVKATGLSSLFFIGDSTKTAHYTSVYVNGSTIGVECQTVQNTYGYRTSKTLDGINFSDEHKVAVTFAKAGKMIFYVDGEKVHEASVSTAFVKGVLSNINYVGFGNGSRAEGKNGYPMNGEISQIKVYSTAKSQQEIFADQFKNLATEVVTTESIKNGADRPAGITDADTLAKIKNLTEGTWSVRFRLDGTKDGLQYLSAVSNDTIDRGFMALYVYKQNGTWKAGVDAPNRNVGGTVNIPESINVLDKRWHELTGVREGTKWTFYMDGTSMGEATSSAAGMFSALDAPNTITNGYAKRLGNVLQYANVTNGSIERARFFTGKLSAAEAKTLASDLKSTGSEVVDLSNAYLSEKNTLFQVGYDGSNAYRIPSLLTTTSGTVIAGIDKRNDTFADQGNIDFVIRRKEADKEDFDEPIVVCDLIEGGAGKKSALLIDSVLLQDTNENSPHKGRIHALVDMFMQSNAAMELANQTPGDEYLHIGDEAYRKVYKDGETQPYAVKEENGIGVVYTTVTADGETTLGEKTDYTVTIHCPAPYKEMGNLYKAGEYKGNIFLNEACAEKGELYCKKTMSIWHFYSDDDGKTWSEPTNITPQIKEDWMIFLGTGPGRGVQLKNGRLVFPAYTCNVGGKLNSQASTIIVSDDYGESWTLKDSPAALLGHDRETFSGGTQTTECQPIQIQNGDLLLFMRTGTGKVKYAVSEDNGETWDRIETVDIPAVYCMYSAINYFDKDGNEYIIVANPSGPARERGIITRGKVNADGTIAWELDKQKLFEPTGYAYSCLTEIAPAEDGTRRFANFYELNNDPISMEYVEFDENYMTADTIAIEESAPKMESFNAEMTEGNIVRVELTMNQKVFREGNPTLTIQAGDLRVELPMVSGSGETKVVFEGPLSAPAAAAALSEGVKPKANEDVSTNFVGMIKVIGLNRTNGDLTSLNGVAAADVKEQDVLDTTVIYPESVVRYTSQYSNSTAENADGAAVNIIDGNPRTFWHSDYSSDAVKVLPQTITFDFGKEVTIDQLNFLNRQTSTNALCKEFRLEGSLDDETWFDIVDSELPAVQTWQSVSFKANTVRYVRFSVDSVHSGNKFATIAELNFNLAAEGIDRSADKSELQGVYDSFAELIADPYTTESWNTFQEELDAAKALLDDENASQLSVDQKVKTLRAAMRSLADKEDLNKDLSAYEDLKEEDYSAATWNAFKAALDDVKANIEDYPTQRDVDKAIMRLKYLAEQLEEGEPAPTITVSMSGDATVDAGSSIELSLSATPEGTAITSAEWSAADASGNAITGVTIAAKADDPSKAVLSVNDDVADATSIVVKASNVNGNAELSAQKTVTVSAETPPVVENKVIDLGPNKLDSVIPDTAEIIDIEGKKAMSGYMSLTDPDLKVTKFLTSGEAFTVSTRVYVPASVNSQTGNLDGGEKFNMIVSIGDNSFAFRFNKGTSGMIMQSYIKTSGWKTRGTTTLADSEFDKWHEVSTVFDPEAKTLSVFFDGVNIDDGEDIGLDGIPSDSNIPLEIGFMSHNFASRQSDVKFSNIKVLKGALTGDQINTVAAGTSELKDEDVVLWLDYAGFGTERAELNAALDEVKDLKAEDYTATSWTAFANAKATAAAMNSRYATADNMADAKAALVSAKEALQPAEPAVEINTDLLDAACKKAASLDLASFSETGKAAFNTAKAAADAELANPTSQEEVNAKALALGQAMLNLRLNVSADKLPE